MTHFKTPKTKPVSIRLTAEERALLDRRAGPLGLSAYIRTRLFDQGADMRRSRAKVPARDQQSLAQVLALLGKTGLASNVAELANAARIGALPVSEETETALQTACAEIAAIKAVLMRALRIQES